MAEVGGKAWSLGHVHTHKNDLSGSIPSLARSPAVGLLHVLSADGRSLTTLTRQRCHSVPHAVLGI